MAGIESIISPRRGSPRVFLPLLGAFLLCVFGLVGCKPGVSFDYTGRWEGMRKVEAKPHESQEILNSIAMIKIDIHKTGSFDMFEAGLKKRGTVSFESEKAILTVTHIMDQPIASYFDNQPGKEIKITLTPQPDGSLEYIDPNGTITDPVNLKKSTQP